MRACSLLARPTATVQMFYQLSPCLANFSTLLSFPNWVSWRDRGDGGSNSSQRRSHCSTILAALNEIKPAKKLVLLPPSFLPSSPPRRCLILNLNSCHIGWPLFLRPTLARLFWIVSLSEEELETFLPRCRPSLAVRPTGRRLNLIKTSKL